MTLIVTGDTDIDRRLLQFVTKRQKAIVRSAARRSLKPVQRAIISNPWPIRTGALSYHIRTNTKIVGLGRSKTHRGAIGARVAVFQRTFKGKTEVLNQGDVFYFGFHELGYKHWRAGKQEGWFKLREIADAKRHEVQETFRKLLGQGIEKELRKRVV